MGNTYVERQYKLLRISSKQLIEITLLTIGIPLIVGLILVFGFLQNTPPKKWQTDTFTLQRIEESQITSGRHHTTYVSRLYSTSGIDYSIKGIDKEEAESIFKIGESYTIYYCQGIAYSRIIKAISCNGTEIFSYDSALDAYNHRNKELSTILIVLVSITLVALSIMLFFFRDNFRLIKKYKSN